MRFSEEKYLEDRATAQLGRAVFIFSCILLLAVYALQLMLDVNGVRGTAYVPDGGAWYSMLEGMLRSKEIFYNNQYEVIKANFLLFFVYYPVVAVGFYAVFFVNTMLLVGMSLIDKNESGEWFPSLFFILAVPFFWFSLALPSKDILVLAITFFAIRLVRRGGGYLLLAMALSLLCFWVRDGYGILLFGVVAMIYTTNIFKADVRWVLLLCLVGVIFFIYLGDFFLKGYFFYDRNFHIASKVSNFSIVSDNNIIGYMLRVFANATNLAFRPQFYFSNGNLDFVGISYWLSGVSLLVTVLLAMRTFFQKEYYDKNLCAVFVLAMLLLISLDPLVQPRYMFATLPAWPVLWRTNKNILMEKILISAFLMAMFFSIYEVAGMPKIQGEPVDLHIVSRMAE